tara:strand:- start:1209 stop:1310 length:102 start_codon:yes stop_codon:yes gene_type:complete
MEPGKNENEKKEGGKKKLKRGFLTIYEVLNSGL